MFDLKNTEYENLHADLVATIAQLESARVILRDTQEDKEVQEHLVARHTATEAKIMDQAFELREVADQQYTDLDKLHDSRDRKR
jgi:hypothetical protein